MILYTTALLSEECLAILLKDVHVHNHSLFGQFLGIEEGTLEAIATYYNNTSELIFGHMIVMWLMHDPESPVKQLSEGLNAIGEHEIATKLTLLSSLGKEANVNRYSATYLFQCQAWDNKTWPQSSLLTEVYPRMGS